MKKIITTIFTILIIFPLCWIYLTNVKVLRVISNSMEPEIKKGSLVIMSKQNNYKVGDIISYKTDQNTVPVTHRIEKIFKIKGNHFFITKGDSNQEEDPYPISEKELIGKVIFVIPKISSMVDNKVLATIIFFTALTFLSFILGKLIKLLN
ncbi:signal peptidase I [Patescibacteria group bacterium]|nr:signal peptidase I [Patescibacteria group bacterium]